MFGFIDLNSIKNVPPEHGRSLVTRPV